MSQLGPDDYRMSLRMGHPDRDLTELCAKLGLAPKVIWQAGDARRTPKGTALGGTRKASYCATEVQHAENQNFSTAIDLITSSLMQHRTALNEFTSSGGRVSLYVSLFPGENAGDTIDVSIVARLADLKISLNLDVYPPDVTRTSEA